MDLILSSGFLALARHLGVLDALETKAIRPRAVVATSSGALVAALWLAGVPLFRIAEFVTARAPYQWMALRASLFGVAVSTRVVERELRQRLPRDFAELPLPFAVGVCDAEGRHRLLRQGDLPRSVAASFAIPGVFHPVEIEGTRFSDGGACDRIGLEAWRHWRPGRRALVHWVERSRGREVKLVGNDFDVIRTPRSQASPLRWGAFYFEREQARTIALSVLSRR